MAKGSGPVRGGGGGAAGAAGAAGGSLAPDDPRRGRRPAASARARASRCGSSSSRTGSRRSSSGARPGIGKTTVAKLIAGATAKAFESLSAVSAGVKDVREIAERRASASASTARGRSSSSTRSTASAAPSRTCSCRSSRRVCSSSSARPPRTRSSRSPVRCSRAARCSGSNRSATTSSARSSTARSPTRNAASVDEPSTIDDDARKHLVDRSEGDARHILTVLEVAHALTVEDGRDAITLADAEAALALRSLRYGDDEHYDIISAFIKSIRGSDPDAGLYWLARMVEAGEDPRYIARRLVILASEDVGLADSNALVVADAAARAVEFVGMPEAGSTSRTRCCTSRWRPSRTASRRRCSARSRRSSTQKASPVPMHLRDSSYRGAQRLGHGAGLRLSSRRAGGMGAAAAPAGGAGGRAVLPSGPARCRTRIRRTARRAPECTARAIASAERMDDDGHE